MLDTMNELTNNPAKPTHLSPQRKRFADAFLTGKSVEQAFIDAGYAPKSANSNSYRLMVNDGIKAYIAFHQAETAERNKITLDEIVRTTREIRDRCMQHRPVLDKKGQQVYGKLGPMYAFQASEAIKANELLAKLGGLVKDAGGDGGGNIYMGIMFNGLPDHLKDKTNKLLKDANPQEITGV